MAANQRIRLQALVTRGERILMAHVCYQGQEWWCLPGGGWEPGETAEEGTLRELREECCLEGQIVRQLSHAIFENGDESITFLVEAGDQEAALGSDPEFLAQGLPQAIREVRYLPLSEIPERDRAFLWASGLLGLDQFWKIVEGWGDDKSYPKKIPPQISQMDADSRENR